MSDQSDKLAAILRRVDIFDNLSEGQYELVAYLCQPISPRRGEILLREQERSDDLYIIAQGGVEVLVDPSQIMTGGRGGVPAERVLAELRDGQVFGEVALVDQGVRSATVRVSKDDTRLLRIHREQLMSLCDTYPELGYKMMKNLAAELAFKIRDTDLIFREYQLALSRERPDQSSQ